MMQLLDSVLITLSANIGAWEAFESDNGFFADMDGRAIGLLQASRNIFRDLEALEKKLNKQLEMCQRQALTVQTP